MDFKLSEDKLKQLASKFEQDLIKLLAPHKKTGKLEKSIKISFIKEGDNYKLSLNALGYIKNLEDGNLLKKFISDKKKELAKEITKTMVQDVKKEIMNSLKQLKK